MNLFRISTLLLAAFVLSACSISLAEDITPPPGSNQPAVMPTQAELTGPLYPLVVPDPANGSIIFVSECAPCHGERGLGDGPMAGQLPKPVAAIGSEELANQSSPAEWYAMVTQGNLDSGMPPFLSLSDRERWDVVAYSFSLSAPHPYLAQGQAVYEATCAACHGEQGQGDGPDAAGLPSAPGDFTDAQAMAERTRAELYDAISNGVEPGMPAYAHELSDADRWAAAAYVQSFIFVPAMGEQAAVETTSEPGGEASSTETPGEAAIPTGTVKGSLVNTSGGEVPGGIPIILHGFDEMQEAYTQEGVAAEDGSFSFENVEMPVGRVFIVSVEYGEATYGSDIAIVEEGTSSLEIPVPIYETTSETTSLSVERAHIFFEYVEPETLRVIELFIISNLGDRTVVGKDGGPSVTFRLPEGASNLQFEDGEIGGRYVQTEDGFGDTAAIRPGQGQHQIVLAFDMPYKRSLKLSQPLDLPVSSIVILAPEDGLKIKSDQFEDAGTRAVQEMTYRMFTSGKFEAGSNLEITVSGKPGASAASWIEGGSTTNLVIGLGAFGLVLVGAGVWLYRRNQEADDDDVLDGSQDELAGDEQAQLPDDADALTDAILALDDQYQAGNLPEEAYLARRAQLKERLKEILGGA